MIDKRERERERERGFGRGLKKIGSGWGKEKKEEGGRGLKGEEN